MTRQIRSIDSQMLRRGQRIAAVTLASLALGAPALSQAQATAPAAQQPAADKVASDDSEPGENPGAARVMAVLNGLYQSGRHIPDAQESRADGPVVGANAVLFVLADAGVFDLERRDAVVDLRPEFVDDEHSQVLE